MAGDQESVETCIFCLIAEGQDKDAKVIRKSKELVCFQDIFPAAPHHYLVVPTQHIVSCLSLHRGHINLVYQMAEMGKAVLHDLGITDMTDIRLGFHLPPYISVHHLHLHVLAPASEISEYQLYKFLPRTTSFIKVNDLQMKLKDIDPPVHCLLRSCITFLQSRPDNSEGATKSPGTSKTDDNIKNWRWKRDGK